MQKLARVRAIGTHADPVMLEVFNNLFMSLAEQMGVSLQNTAYSVNIKERLDFSCAVFDGNGTLVANAPHIPVHLGSMDRTVETIIRENEGKIRPGDVYAINAPYNGGTHLPDITVCTPVFSFPSPTRAALARARVQACWGRVGWGVGRPHKRVDGCRSVSLRQCVASRPPPPAPPHKGEGRYSSGSPRAAIMPMSAACRRAR